MSAITYDVGMYISDREKALFKGAREKTEWGPFEIVLYWEPHFENVKGKETLTKSFTIDVSGPLGPLLVPRWRFARLADDVSGPLGPSLVPRWRFARLADADAKKAELDQILMIEMAKIAFRIPRD